MNLLNEYVGTYKVYKRPLDYRLLFYIKWILNLYFNN